MATTFENFCYKIFVYQKILVFVKILHYENLVLYGMCIICIDPSTCIGLCLVKHFTEKAMISYIPLFLTRQKASCIEKCSVTGWLTTLICILLRHSTFVTSQNFSYTHCIMLPNVSTHQPYTCATMSVVKIKMCVLSIYCDWVL